MKIKFVAIYALAGAAFLVVSLWAFLSGGRSARAVRYKYKLGGIMLTAWAMISAVSCEGFPPTVTCYEPEVMCYEPVRPNSVFMSVKDHSSSNDIQAGYVIEIQVSNVSYEEFCVKILAGNENMTVLQSAAFAPDAQDTRIAKYKLTVGQFDYKGKVTVAVYGVVTDENGNKQEDGVVGEQVFNAI